MEIIMLVIVIGLLGSASAALWAMFALYVARQD